ncbi:hypothetical protein GCM10010350_31230 [Streptomyces galilaeus]|nr:hypothetical protein GCM10010350_31230 [Streptomyces galilaeus]
MGRTMRPSAPNVQVKSRPATGIPLVLKTVVFPVESQLMVHFIKARARRGRAPPLRRGLPPVSAPDGRVRGRVGGSGHAYAAMINRPKAAPAQIRSADLVAR